MTERSFEGGDTQEDHDEEFEANEPADDEETGSALAQRVGQQSVDDWMEAFETSVTYNPRPGGGWNLERAKHDLKAETVAHRQSQEALESKHWRI